jgi:membrane fusion protein, multidrug efflux system
VGLLALQLCVACGRSGEAATAKKSLPDDPPAASKRPGNAPTSDSGGTRGRGPSGPSGAPGVGGRGPLAVVLGPTDVADVKRGLIESAMAIQGDLKPIEEIVVRARIEGNITNVLVREGDRVSKGQVMANFESSNQEAAQKSALADLESAKADVSVAQWNADQSAQLLKAGAIPERDLKTAEQTLVAAQARQAAAESKLRATSQDMVDTRVLAPATGVVSTRSVGTGEHVSRGATVFTVVRNDILELTAALPARFAGDVIPSLPVRFNAAGRELNGKVARVSPTIDPANRSIAVYLQVPNRDGSLKGNTFATGRIISRSVPDALLIPTAAIKYQQASPKPFVYRIAHQAIEYAPVELGIIDDVTGMAQVTTGLSEGDQIVVGNIGALGRGVKVTIARASDQGNRGRPVGGNSGNGGDESGRKGRGRRGGDNPVPRPPQ